MPVVKRRAASLDEKLDIISDAMKTHDYVSIALKHKVCVSSVYTIIRKRRETIRATRRAIESAARNYRLFGGPIEKNLRHGNRSITPDSPDAVADSQILSREVNLSPNVTIDNKTTTLPSPSSQALLPLHVQTADCPRNDVPLFHPLLVLPMQSNFSGQNVLASLKANTASDLKPSQPEMTLDDPQFVPLTTNLWNFKFKLPTICID